MTPNAFLPLPPPGFETTVEYRLRPRPKRAFHTILDSNRLLAPGSKGTLRFSDLDDAHIELATRYDIASGAIEESFILRKTLHGLQSERLMRRMLDSEGRQVRREEVDFGADLGLAPNTYPEVLLPLMLGWPAAERTRAFYSWINDRFVSRVYVETKGETDLELGGRTTRALEMVLFPDLNDFVRVGSTMARLAKPIMPKYHLWFDPKAPNTVLRFEGPYGPPGAPELIMERIG
ncbi:MAG: hypothetical protein AMJ62_00620 [Myxococcales bacterium SG8_38]|nr:MAG: hypothetical protein AMJ62_00620 [Myxococcales bacterium SG8_38]